MENRQLGYSGLKVPVLSYGTGTFGGANEFFKAWGSSDVAEATRLVDICLEAGVNLFDTADIYSDGVSEEILGKAIAGKWQPKSMPATFIVDRKGIVRFVHLGYHDGEEAEIEKEKGEALVLIPRQKK